MSHKSLFALPSAILLAAVVPVVPLAAQGTCFYSPDNGGTGSNVTPFGNLAGGGSAWMNQKYQMLVHPGDVKNTAGVITSLAFGGPSTVTHYHSSLVIKLDHFPGPGTTMSSTFANNLTSQAVTVLDAKDYVWHRKAGRWSRIGLQKPFAYNPALGPLVIEITCQGSVVTRTTPYGSPGCFDTGLRAPIRRPRIYALGNTWVNGKPPAQGSLSPLSALRVEVCYGVPDLSTYGKGCPGSNGLVPAVGLSGSASLGKSITLAVANTLPSAQVFLAIGLTPYNRPVDMGIAGASNCRLYHSVDFLFSVMASAQGVYSGSFLAPTSNSAVGVRAYVQFAPLDKNANNLGASFSDFGRILIGR